MFCPLQGTHIILDLSINSPYIRSGVPLTSHKDFQLLNMPFSNLNKVNNYVASKSYVMLDELAERSMMRPLAGTRHTYASLATYYDHPLRYLLVNIFYVIYVIYDILSFFVMLYFVH